MKLPADFNAFYNELDSVKRKIVDHNSELIEVTKGATVFEQQSVADAVYAIEKGVVEIIVHNADSSSARSAAYLSRGDIFGEMGVITGKPRIATVRACEPAWLRKFTGEQFIRLIERIPAFGIFLTANLAERLYRATADHYFMSYCVDFRGNTENFDLLIIFQTLQSSGRTGELQLTNANNDIVGSFFFLDGNVIFAQFAHLRGVEAVWQLFLEEKIQGSFAFQICKKPIFKHDKSFQISLTGMDLLMQAAAKRDLFQNVDPALKNLDRVLSRTAEELTWDNPENSEAAKIVWQQIHKRPHTVGTVWRLSNLSISTLLDVISGLRERGLVDLSTEPQPAS